MFTELIKFSSVFGSKYKQKINAHLHSSQQTYRYTSCANMQIKIIIFRFGQILSRCFTILSRQCIHHRKGNFICYSLSTTIKPTEVFSKQNNVTFSVIYKREAKLQNTPNPICILLNNNSIYCCRPRSSKHTDTCNGWVGVFCNRSKRDKLGDLAASNRTSRYIFAKINVQTTILNLV